MKWLAELQEHIFFSERYLPPKANEVIWVMLRSVSVRIPLHHAQLDCSDHSKACSQRRSRGEWLAHSMQQVLILSANNHTVVARVPGLTFALLFLCLGRKKSKGTIEISFSRRATIIMSASDFLPSLTHQTLLRTHILFSSVSWDLHG